MLAIAWPLVKPIFDHGDWVLDARRANCLGELGCVGLVCVQEVVHGQRVLEVELGREVRGLRLWLVLVLLG